MALPATDIFTDTDGVQLTTHSASWTLNRNDFDIRSNALSPDFASGSPGYSAAHWNADAFANDQYSQVKIVAVTGHYNYNGVCVRAHASDATWYSYFGEGNESLLFKIVASTATQLGSAGTHFHVNDIIYLKVDGTTLTPNINGSTTGTPGAQSDNAIASGSAGIGGYQFDANHKSDNRIDDWEGGDIGSTTATGTANITLAAFTLSASGISTITGSLVKTLANATLSASSGIVTSGNLSITLSAFTLSASANALASGSLIKTLANANLTSSGSIPSVGTLDITLASTTLISTGSIPSDGSLSKTLADFSLTGIGTAGNSGSLDKILAGATLLSSGTSIVTGVLSKTLDNATLISAGSIPENGILEKTLSDFTVSATGISTAYADGNLNVTLANSTLIAAGTSTITAQLSKSLAPFTIVSSGIQTNAGQLDSTLAGATVSSAGIGTQITAILIAILSNATLTASGITPVHWHQNQLRPRIWTRDFIARNNIKYRKRKL